MRKTIFILLIALSTSVFSQKVIDEGVVKIKMTMSSEDPKVNDQLSMLVGDVSMMIHFKGNNSRSEINNPLQGNNTTIVNSDAKRMLILQDDKMLGKTYKEDTIDLENKNTEGVTVTENGETKTILGYVCKGYDIVGNFGGAATNMTIYTTDKIKAINPNNPLLRNNTSGFPMLVFIKSTEGGVAVTIAMEVIEVKDQTVDNSLFSLDIPKGYTRSGGR